MKEYQKQLPFSTKPYMVQYQKRNIFASPSELPYEFAPSFDIQAKGFADAAREAVSKIVKIALESPHMDVFNARIILPNKTRREILKEGDWLVDTDTGKRTVLAKNQ